MSDFIERRAAIKLFNFAVLDCLGMEPTIRAGDIIKALESIPAADVRPVVTCGECKHYRNGMCYNPNTYDDGKTCGNTTPEWFCADGVKDESAEMRYTNCTQTTTADEEREVLNVRAWLRNGADMREES